ncbi:zinc metallopeptidase [Rubeoparvulum massiliense]|uniref:zinc metallopeptidase n=1 Tax=Rubeoparvulum massiliense TaxID=1631346 RepID=UPI0009E597FE|nr:zinc metallopeptidase [Rubeoparvulum massiliense]
MIFDATMILIIPAILLSLYAQFKVQSAYGKYSKIGSTSGMRGVDVARQILQSNGVYNVDVEVTQGRLTDHYDPIAKKVRLSEENYYGNSLAAIAVSAHECGHAMQDAQGYAFLRFRHAIFPVVNIASQAAFPLILLGFFFSNTFLLLGIIFFLVTVIFQAVTLPVEFNASSRALTQIQQLGIVTGGREQDGARNVLTAAALTYVAAALTAVLELLRLILIFTNREE